MPLTRQEIKDAVVCTNWQTFRVSLKAHSTERKLFWLLEYVKPIDWSQRRATDPGTVAVVALKECCDYDTRCVQALNYVTALSRGGQIGRVHPSWQFKDQVQKFLASKRYRVVR